MARRESAFQPPPFRRGDHSPAHLATAARAWHGLLLQEERSRLLTARLVSDLKRLDAPAFVVTEAQRVADDEERHVAICSHLIRSFVGQCEVPELEIATLPPDDAGFSRAVTELLVAGFAVGETMSVGAFVAIREVAREPLVRWALSALAGDEVWHGRFGETAAAWALRDWSVDERRELWPVCIGVMENVEERAGGPVGAQKDAPRSEPLLTLGVPTVAITGMGILEAIPRWVLPRLTRLGVI